MVGTIAAATLVLAVAGCWAQAPAVPQAPPRPKFEAFEVATVKPVEYDKEGGRYIKMEGPRRFVARQYTLKLLIAAAYELNPKAISGGPGWVDGDHFDIVAGTPGEVLPNHDEQMTMLRRLLVDRFKLTFHREAKEFSLYALEVAKGGPKLKASAAAADAPVTMGPGVVYSQRIVLPARNATMGSLASILQRGILDRPVVDKTGLTGRYDFDLEWAPDESQFGGDVPAASTTAPLPPLFAAIQEQLGLRLEAMHGPVEALVVDSATRPVAD